MKRLLLVLSVVLVLDTADADLLTNLISYWKLDETSGTRVDAVTGTGNDLTDNNTVGSTTGKINNAANFVAANSESLSRVSNASLQTGDIDFTIAAWVNMASKPSLGVIASKLFSPTILEYYLRYIGVAFGGDYFQFEVSSNGTPGGATGVVASNLGSPSTSTWYFIVCWHDSVNNLLGISVNNGTPNTTAYPNGVFAGTATFVIGDSASGSNSWDGAIDEVGFWKRVLTAQEITQLYNGGAGLAYPFTTGANNKFFPFFPP